MIKFEYFPEGEESKEYQKNIKLEQSGDITTINNITKTFRDIAHLMSFSDSTINNYIFNDDHNPLTTTPLTLKEGLNDEYQWE